MIDIRGNSGVVKLVAQNSDSEEVTYLLVIKELTQTLTTPRMPISVFGEQKFAHMGKSETEVVLTGRLIAVSDKKAAVAMTLREAIEEIEAADRFEGVG